MAPCLPGGRAGSYPGRVSSMGWAGEGENQWSVVARKEQRANRPSFSNCSSPHLTLAWLQLSPGCIWHPLAPLLVVSSQIP